MENIKENFDETLKKYNETFEFDNNTIDFFLKFGLTNEDINKIEDIIHNSNGKMGQKEIFDHEKDELLQRGFTEYDIFNLKCKRILAKFPEALTIKQLKKLVKSTNDHGVYYILANNENTPSEILNEIFKLKYSDNYCILALCKNPNTSTETLNKILDILLKSDENDSPSYHFILDQLSKNPNVTQDILDKLATL